jgi:hypothetical protein
VVRVEWASLDPSAPVQSALVKHTASADQTDAKLRAGTAPLIFLPAGDQALVSHPIAPLPGTDYEDDWVPQQYESSQSSRIPTEEIAAIPPLRHEAPVERLDRETVLVQFTTSPFPYQGKIPSTGKEFLDVLGDGQRGHTAPRGGVYWEKPTYSDHRVLLHLPKTLDLEQPALMVVFFHGNHASLNRDVRIRQHVPKQLDESGLNAVLVAPQFAVDANDSSAGHFWEPGFFSAFLKEAGVRLTEMSGARQMQGKFDAMPVLIVAYSGGYNPAAWSALRGGVGNRLRGVILLDALVGETEIFAEWLSQKGNRAFFISAYSDASVTENKVLQRMLIERGVKFVNTRQPRLDGSEVSFLDAGSAIPHNDFVSLAWVRDPIKVLLARIPEFRLRSTIPVASQGR